MRNPIVPILTITLAVVAELWALAPGSDAPPILQAEQLMVERKFDDVLAHLRATVEQYRAGNPAISAMAQYRLGLYLGYIKEHSPNRQYWLAQVETELRRVETDFATQIEAVSLARIKLIDALLGQGKIDEARRVAQILVETTAEWPEYNAWGRLKRIEVGLAIASEMSGEQITAAQQVAIPHLDQVIASAEADYPEVANWARVRLLSTLVSVFQFERAPSVCQDVLNDHAAGRASDKQVAWALVLEANTFTRQQRFEEAIPPLEMAIAIADPNHLDMKYRAEGDLRKVYGAMVDRDYALGESALFKDKDVEMAARWFEYAHGHALLANGHKLEPIRMHLARIAQRDKDFDRAIAWWRLAIHNPRALSGGAIEAVDVIAWLFREKKHQPEQEEQWRLYLAGAVREDPTAPLVAAVLGAAPTEVQEDKPLMGFERRLDTLLRLYRSQDRLAAAKAAFEETLKNVTTDRERAAVLSKIAFCQRQLAGRRAARSAADQAADLWLKAIVETPEDHDANYMIDLARANYDTIGMDDKAVEIMERVVAALALENSPGRASYARLQLAREYASNGRDADAKAWLDQTLRVILDHPFSQGYEWICVHMIKELAFLHIHEGDLATGQSWLDQIGYYWPGKHDRELGIYYEYIERVARPGD